MQFFCMKKFHLDGSRVDEVSNLLYLDYGMDAGSGDLNIFSATSRSPMFAEESAVGFN